MANKGQKPPTKAVPVMQGKQMAAGGKGVVASGKPMPFKKGGKAC